MLYHFFSSYTICIRKWIEQNYGIKNANEFSCFYFLDLDFDGRHKWSQESSERFHWNDGTVGDHYQQVNRDLYTYRCTKIINKLPGNININNF